MRKQLIRIYDLLFRAYGPQGWWPGETPFEVMVGAILTQNTSWKNVEKSICQLKEKGVLTPEGMLRVKPWELASLIKSSGFFRTKTERLKTYVQFMFEEFDGEIERMRSVVALKELRDKLLSVKGIGPETADSILLYALGKPIFVVDAYTRRILSRHGILSENAGYQEVQTLFMSNLPWDEALFNEFHALLVHLGKWVCRKKAKCDVCPLKGLKKREVEEAGR